jgi:hypothetical protein
MKKLVIFIILITPFYASCQLRGARNLALGNTFIAQKDIISASQNIAKLSSIEGFSAALTSKNNFMIKSLQESMLCMAFPLFKGFAAINYSVFGFRLYRESALSLSYAMSLSPSLSIGIKVLGNFIFISENQKRAFSIYPNAGLNYILNDKLEFGFLLSNLSLSKKIKQTLYTWPVTITFGTIYHLNDKLTSAIDLSLNIEEKSILALGIEYQVNSFLYLRTGLHSFPASISMGMGIKRKDISFDFASSYQNFLGFTPSISLRFEPDP